MKRTFIDADYFKDWLLSYSITDKEREESMIVCYWIDRFITRFINTNNVIEKKYGRLKYEAIWSDPACSFWYKWKCNNCDWTATEGWGGTKAGKKPDYKYCPYCGVKFNEQMEV